MPVSLKELRPHLQAFDFPRLFVEGLGWDNYVTKPYVVHVNERDYSAQSYCGQKAGFAVYECDSSVDNHVPQYPVRRKIENRGRQAHLSSTSSSSPTQDRKTQVWQWVRRESGKPAACREQVFRAGQAGEPILQRLRSVVFTLDDESKGHWSSADVTSRVRKAFDIEKVTKRFYDKLQGGTDRLRGVHRRHHGPGRPGLVRLPDAQSHDVRLLSSRSRASSTRDPDYLRNRLQDGPKEQTGGGRFQQFYRLFLLALCSPRRSWDSPRPSVRPNWHCPPWAGCPSSTVASSNVHDLERDNPDISIPDAAFERVFELL